MRRRAGTWETWGRIREHHKDGHKPGTFGIRLSHGKGGLRDAWHNAQWVSDPTAPSLRTKIWVQASDITGGPGQAVSTFPNISSGRAPSLPPALSYHFSLLKPEGQTLKWKGFPALAAGVGGTPRSAGAAGCHAPPLNRIYLIFNSPQK